MAKFIPKDRNNRFKSFWRKFNSLDLFTRLFVVTLILLAISTPFVVYNYQLYNARGESQAERLQEIRGLQGYHNNYKNALARSQSGLSENRSSEKIDTPTSNPNRGFNLIDALQRFLISILGIFNKSK
jgi:hypothetical protein